jgi:aminoglycoside phosphotransferase (APT) family kinase protein
MSRLTRLQGGYETSTYHFALGHASAELSGPLVLRLYPQFYGASNAIWESAVQNVLAGEGYPVARAHVLCTDVSILGGAFFIMDHLPGQPLLAAPPETLPGLLGRTHAELHDIDPAPLISTLNDRGFAERDYRLTGRFDWLRRKAEQLPWIRPGVTWLLENRPCEPEQLTICHGDFHPLNILYSEGKVTGVLDWPGFAIADPAFDVACSLVLMTTAARHIAASIEGLASVDWDRAADLYLASYRTHRSLDGTHLDYYRVRRCVAALIGGFDGQKVWQHPLIVRDLLACVRAIADVRITTPLES